MQIETSKNAHMELSIPVELAMTMPPAAVPTPAEGSAVMSLPYLMAVLLFELTVG